MVQLDQFSVGVLHDSWKEWRDALKFGDNNVSGKKEKVTFTFIGEKRRRRKE